MCRILNGGSCIATDCSTLQLEILLSLRRFIDKKQTNKPYLQKVCIYHLQEKITKIERSLTNHEAKSPMAQKSSVCSILKQDVFDLSCTYHWISISCSTLRFDSQGFTTGDNSGMYRISPDQSKQISAISSREQIFKSAFRVTLNGNTSSLMKNIDITAMGLLIN